MTFSAKIWPSFDSYGHLHVKNYQNHFHHGYQHPIWPKMDKNWVYFGPFRPKIDPKMVSYNITFTKKWFITLSFHLFTQIRIILDYHVWDHFCTKRNLNKQIWVFLAPLFDICRIWNGLNSNFKVAPVSHLKALNVIFNLKY